MGDTANQNDGELMGQGMVNGTAPETRKQVGKGKKPIAWLVFLAILLGAVYVVAVQTIAGQHAAIHTGDALYDKYLAWIIEDYEYNFNPDKPEEKSKGLSNVVGEIDPFADWEAEFSDDPRYWMLRYRYSKRDSPVRGESPLYETSYLQHARELGIADGATLFLLLGKSDDEIWSQYKPDGPSWKVPLEQKVIDEKLQRSKVDELMGAEHDQLLAELLDIAGAESLPHYYAAMFDSQRGDYSAALVHLIEGNRAPNHTNMIGFPFDLHLAGINVKQPKLSKIASGSIFADEFSTSMPYSTQLRNMVKAMAADATSRDDRATLAELHKFGCRFGTAEGNRTIDFMEGNMIIRMVASTYLEKREKLLSMEQTDNLNKLLGLKDQTKAQIKVSMENDSFLHPWGTTPLQKTFWHIRAKVTRGRSAMRSLYESIHNDFSKEQANNFGPVKELFQQMEAFNYNTLEFE